MRTRFIVQFLSLAVVVAVGVTWMKSRTTAIALQERLAALSAYRRTNARALEEERDRLRTTFAEAELRRLAEASVAPVAPAPIAPQRVVAPSLTMGEWRSPREWRNEGQSTVRGTVASLLWAAAGGDVAAMTRLIAYDEAGRARAQAFFDTLPPAVRQTFPTPEALVAGLTIPAVPTSAVQLSWFNQRDADHATVGLLLSAPDQTPPTELHVMPSQDNAPPMLSAPQSIQFTFLSLQRSAQGWQVVIPAAAVERLASRYKTATN